MAKRASPFARRREPVRVSECLRARCSAKASASALQRLRRQLLGEELDEQRGLIAAHCGLAEHREAKALARLVVGLRHGTREAAHAADVGGALGDRDRAARIEQVEGVRAFSTIS